MRSIPLLVVVNTRREYSVKAAYRCGFIEAKP
jgi:hypothetical protein